MFEALTPAIGYLLGYMRNDWIADGAYLGRYAGILGRFVLVAIGGSILIQHLTA